MLHATCKPLLLSKPPPAMAPYTVDPERIEYLQQLIGNKVSCQARQHPRQDQRTQKRTHAQPWNAAVARRPPPQAEHFFFCVCVRVGLWGLRNLDLNSRGERIEGGCCGWVCDARFFFVYRILDSAKVEDTRKLSSGFRCLPPWPEFF